jgi:hypothetical protein
LEGFAQNGIELPRSLDDLKQPEYRDLLVVQDPATSSPGQAFMLATISRYGDAWEQYWQALRENGVDPAAILLEPMGRNTAPAVTIAALQATARGDDPLLLVLAADDVALELVKLFLYFLEHNLKWSH